MGAEIDPDEEGGGFVSERCLIGVEGGGGVGWRVSFVCIVVYPAIGRRCDGMHRRRLGGSFQRGESE